MTKRALLAIAGIFSLALSLPGQETQPVPFELSQPGQGGVVDTRSALDQTNIFSTLNNAHLSFFSLALADARLFSLSGAFNGIAATPPDFLPALPAEEPTGTQPIATAVRHSTEKVVEVRPKFFDYAGGEVGFLYGRSTGKFGRELEQGYIFGEVGNDKVHITAGAFYQESSGRFPHLGH